MSAEKFAIPSLRVLEEDWTIEDLIDAHLVLDMYEELAEKEEKARQKQ